MYGVSGATAAFSYSYLAQLVPESHIPFVAMLYTGCDTLTVLIQVLYFAYISHYCEYYMLYLIIMSGVVVVLGAIFLVEPPISLLLNGQLARAHNHLEHIKTFNRVGYKQIKLYDVHQQIWRKKIQNDSLNLRSFARFACASKMTVNVIVMVICLCLTMYNFFLVEFEI